VTYIQVVLAILKIVSTLIRLGEQRQWIADGERRAIARGLADAVKAAHAAKAIRREIEAMTDDEVDAGLAGDYRDRR
jgi:hypothetical protein